ncbi:MAG: HDOD domain-containing protein, partial [Planctomycetes bacterium]|nr:HDOD domain-containing protein [Planctomycetota bacterium]
MTRIPENNPTPAADRLQDRQIELILDQLESLPTLPEVAVRILHLTASSRSDVQQIIDLIKTDQALTARILSLASRVEAGLREEVRTIDRAIVMLGFETVRSTVMSIKVFEMFDAPEAPPAGLNRREFWKHCLAVACACELLAQQTDVGADPDELFVCGLLHDIGKLALEQCLPKSYTRVVESCNAQYGNIAEYERRIIGVDHTIAGRRLAQKWQLPALIENAVWLHHQPVEALPAAVEHGRAVALVHLADTMAREQRFGYSGNFIFPASSARLAEQIGLSAEAVGEVLERLPGAIEQRARTMGMGETTSEELFRSALANANAELGRLNAKLRRRAVQTAWQVKALTDLLKFSRELTGRETLGQLTGLIARTWADALGLEPTPLQPVVAYTLSRTDDTAVVARHTAAEGTATELVRTRRDLSSIPVPADGMPGPTAMRKIVADAGNLQSWLANEALVHRPLIFGCQWVGGLLWPAAAAGDLGAEGQQAVTLSLAYATAITAMREQSARMTEQLVQSSQQLYAMQKSLAETRALAAVGEMAAGAAHEMNNPLTVIAGRAQLMAGAAEGSDRSTWQTIAEQAQKLSDIVTELMEFARPPTPRPAAARIADAVERARRLAGADARGLEVRTAVAPGTPPVWADPDQLARALAELLANAADAYEAGGRVVVEAKLDDVTGQVLIRVVDTGRGMDAQTQENAFTPFFSAKAAGRRRGMGLSRARRLLQLASG